MATGMLSNALVLSPLVIVLQGRMTHSLLVSLTDDISGNQAGFEKYYASLGKYMLHIAQGLLSHDWRLIEPSVTT